MTNEENFDQQQGNTSGRNSKHGKKQKNLFLSAHARGLLTVLSYNLGISETAVVELLVREKAARENITLPPEPPQP